MKKFLSVVIILAIIGIAITPICTTKNNSPEMINKTPIERIFGLRGNINFSYNKDAYLSPIMPLTGSVSRPIHISHKVSGLFAPFIIKVFQIIYGRTISINMSIDDKPDFATVRVTPNNVFPEISSDWKTDQAYIHISLDENAPAYEVCYFTLNGTSESLTGPFGFLTWAPETVYVEKIPFVPLPGRQCWLLSQKAATP